MANWPSAIQLFLHRLWNVPRHVYRYAKLPQLKPGDIYLDCGWHPVVCTSVERSAFHRWVGPWDRDIAGISLVDGSTPRSCSQLHCGPIKIPYDAAEHIVSLMLDSNSSDDLNAILEQRRRGTAHIRSIYRASPELKQLWR